MASLNSLYLKLDTLKTLVSTLEKKGAKGIEFTVSINDESNDYGQNISAFVAQTKEQREAKKSRYYVGNGKTFWTDGKISVLESSKTKNSQITEAEIFEDVDDLPF